MEIRLLVILAGKRGPSKSTKIPELVVTKIPDPRTKKLLLITPFAFKILSPVAGPLDIYDC